MFYLLILSHFLGDFPLQPNWMARRKSEFWVLSLHVSIHFVLMFLLVGKIRYIIWPQLLLLVLVHMGQDRLKISLTKLWPALRVHFFFIDQFLHYFALLGLVIWLQIINPNLIKTQPQFWVVLAIAYLVVTFTWYIIEQVIYQADNEYLKYIQKTKISRMLARGGLVSLFIFLRSAVLPNLAFVLSPPYPPSKYRKRALLSDLSISLFVIIFLFVSPGVN
jgi:Protein of unknown function (DUF3307)